MAFRCTDAFPFFSGGREKEREKVEQEFLRLFFVIYFSGGRERVFERSTCL